MTYQADQDRHHHEVMSELERADADFYGAPEYIHLALTHDEREELLPLLFECLYDPAMTHPEKTAIAVLRDYADAAFQRYLKEGYTHD